MAPCQLEDLAGMKLVSRGLLGELFRLIPGGRVPVSTIDLERGSAGELPEKTSSAGIGKNIFEISNERFKECVMLAMIISKPFRIDGIPTEAETGRPSCFGGCFQRFLLRKRNIAEVARGVPHPPMGSRPKQKQKL